MYNRYIPQSDGSYRRRTVQQPAQPQAQQPQQPKPAPTPHPEPPPSPQQNPPAAASPLSFLKNLLPKEFDTADLLIVLLLLLMAGDKPDEKNDALLTLALYFFM